MFVFIITYRNKLNTFSHSNQANLSIFFYSNTQELQCVQVEVVLIGIAMATNGFFMEGSIQRRQV